VIDLHCHLLPGIDDGPTTPAEALELGRRLVDEGVQTVVATPHIDRRWRVEPRLLEDAVVAMRAAVEEASLPLRVLRGGEVALPRLVDLDDDEREMVRLGDGPYLLLECPLTPAAGSFDDIVVELIRRGQPIVLAHPERSPFLRQRPERVAKMVEGGALCSLTAGALEGRFGQPVRRFALKLLEEGLVHNVASDSHDAVNRGPGLQAGLQAAQAALPGILDHAQWLTEEVPGAVVDGRALPPRPPLRLHRRRRLFGRLRASPG